MTESEKPNDGQPEALDSEVSEAIVPEPASPEPVAEAKVEPPVPPPAAAAAPQEEVKQKSPRSFLAVLAFFLALLSLGASGWVYQQLQHTIASTGIEEKAAAAQRQLRGEVEKQLKAQQSAVREQMEGLRREMQAATSTAASIEQTLNTRMVNQARDISSRISLAERSQLAIEKEIEMARQEMITVRAKLNSMSSSERSDWLLAETEYLMRLANQRLLISKDFVGAADMLRSADAILVELDDSGFNTVRSEIAKEIGALEVSASFDVEGLYFKLESLANQAEKLDLYQMPGMEKAAEKKPLTGDWQSRAKQGVMQAWEKLSSYVKFTEKSDHYERLISPEQEAALRYSVRLMFEQAQLALMAGRQELYRRSMQRAADTIGKFYAIDEPVARLVGKVEALVGEKVRTQTPDISGSLRALKLYVETVHRPRQAGQERG